MSVRKPRASEQRGETALFDRDVRPAKPNAVSARAGGGTVSADWQACRSIGADERRAEALRRGDRGFTVAPGRPCRPRTPLHVSARAACSSALGCEAVLGRAQIGERGEALLVRLERGATDVCQRAPRRPRPVRGVEPRADGGPPRPVSAAEQKELEGLLAEAALRAPDG